jgi:CubicO group peptidase (beta-lactamase class C family)
MAIKIFTYTVLLIFFSNFKTSAEDFSALNNYIVRAKSITKSVSGTSVVLIKDGEIVHEFHDGMADVENHIPVDTNSVYYFASTTKAIMGLAVLQAEQKGLLTRNFTLDQLFPNIDFKYIDANNYTVKDLLSHTSGLTNEAMTWTFSYLGNHNRARRLRFLSSLRMATKINKGEFNYSNLGYNLMAIWFDENYKGGWTRAMKELVLAPAGMTNSTANVDQARRDGWPIPKPYSYKFQNGQKKIYMNKNNDTLYSVGIFARPHDWAKLITHLLPINSESSAFPKSVVRYSREVLVDDIDSYFSGYGWGWMHSAISNEQVLVHTGGFDGASVEVSYSPAKNIGVVIVHNESGLIANELNGSVSEIAYKMLTGKAIDDAIKIHLEEMKANAVFVKKTKATLTTKRKELSQRPKISKQIKNLLEGTYKHGNAGSVIFTQKNKELFMMWGDLQSKVYPGLSEREFVVELRPGKFFDMKLNKSASVIFLKEWEFYKE